MAFNCVFDCNRSVENADIFKEIEISQRPKDNTFFRECITFCEKNNKGGGEGGGAGGRLPVDVVIQ